MEQYEFLTHIVRCLEALKIPYFITGAVASIAYGEPRLTNDIDIVVDLEEDDILQISEELIDFSYIDLWAKRLGLESLWLAIRKKIAEIGQKAPE